MLKRQIDLKRKAMATLNEKDADFDARNNDLIQAISEAESEDEQRAVQEEIEKYETEKAAHEQEKTDLDEEIRGLEADLDKIENEQTEAEPEAEERTEQPVPEKRGGNTYMNKRNFYGMNAQERDAFIAREDVQSFLGEVRTCIKEKRALTNVGLTIPVVLLDLLRENILEYSKLYKHVNVRAIAGEGRQVIMGTIPEAVWTDCCANLNELDLSFADVELNCWRVGGYFAVCNANLEDSDIDLASELLIALGQAIGLALDKAILYGTGSRMPLGVVTRLCQTSQPADYPATARTWVDLHTSNVKTINSAGMTAVQLIAAIVTAFGNAKGKYSRGEKVFAMNEKTYTALAAATVSVAADGAIVTGVLGQMPVVGGAIEVLDFIPDNVIIGGFFDLYTLGERAGNKFATSEHVKFLQDQTVFRGTARYDGQPAIAEGFVAIGINNTTPNASMVFAPDTANEEESDS